MNGKMIAVRSALTFAVLAMGALAQAATYHVTLLKPSMVAGQELKPGDYKVEVNNGNAVLTRGKQSVETKVQMQAADRKYDSTTVRYQLDGQKYTLQEIGIGGTTTKLVINGTESAAGAF